MKKTRMLMTVLMGSVVFTACGPQTTTPETPEPGYNAESWKTELSPECKHFFDGCNNSMKMEGSEEAACTLMYCESYEKPACLDQTDAENLTPNADDQEPQVWLANPASEYCVAQGGKSENRTNEQGEYGVCVMPNGDVLDEWEFYHQQELSSEYLGMSVTQALSTAQEKGDLFRIIEEDGTPNAITADLRPGRINATVEKGVIVKVYIE